jgi:adenosylhomocysteine nucleosidase
MAIVRKRLHGATGVVLAITGDGPSRAERGLAAFLQATPCAGVIAIGLAGALTTDLRAGDLVTARKILDEDGRAVGTDARLLSAAEASGAMACTLVSRRAIVRSAAEKAALADGNVSGPAAVDLESAAWARAAARFGLPFVVLRVIADAADDEIPGFIADSARPDGSIRRERVVLAALGSPRQRVPELIRLARAARRASHRLAEAVDLMTCERNPGPGRSRRDARDRT